MEQARTPAGIEDLFRLTLADGLPATSEGKTIRYMVVRLRETGVAHERAALKQAERVVMIGGQPRLLVSDAEFKLALTVQHIECFECDGQRLSAAVIDLDLVGKLSTHDMALIEQRVFLLTLAAEVRYGNFTQADFDEIVAGRAPAGKLESPQPVGQIPGVGADATSPESGPALLADYAGSAAAGTPSGDGH